MVINPAVLTGKPIIKGTRLAVEFIIDLLAHDWSESEILWISRFDPWKYPGVPCGVESEDRYCKTC